MTSSAMALMEGRGFSAKSSPGPETTVPRAVTVAAIAARVCETVALSASILEAGGGGRWRAGRMATERAGNGSVLRIYRFKGGGYEHGVVRGRGAEGWCDGC